MAEILAVKNAIFLSAAVLAEETMAKRILHYRGWMSVSCANQCGETGALQGTWQQRIRDYV